jgi:RNA polymerase sigma factor (sigma-70 family)
MAGKTSTDRARDPGRAGRVQAALGLSDAQLLDRFVGQRDEAAFEAILRRHGPLVFGVCRRLLFNAHDAEDAFQATFLVLARRARVVAPRALLGNWLYGVAYRVAARARKIACRRRTREQSGADLTAVPDREQVADPELAPLLHAEVSRLPDKYRSPVVLCYLEGKTNEEAARQLQWPVGTVKIRLSRARELLRSRLARRGVALTAGLLAANTLTAPAPAALVEGTIQAALSFAAGGAVAGGASAQALALTQGVLRSMLLSKLKVVVAVILSVAVVAGVGGLAYHLGLAVDPQAKDKPKEDAEAILGTWEVVKAEVEGKEPDDAKAGVVKGLTMVFTKGKIAVTLPDGTLRESAYKLDPTQKPKAIDINYQDREVTEHVYTLEGDTLKICGSIPGSGKGRPTEVASKEGSKTMLITLKRKAKDK